MLQNAERANPIMFSSVHMNARNECVCIRDIIMYSDHVHLFVSNRR